MTSETEAIKTNEFLRRRKLRLQQVREQSKDIAKKIRQRAKVEKLRQVVDLDAKKQKEYFECQEKLVKRLEVLYAKGLENVGAGHQSASEVTQQDEVVKTDLSKLRGREATAELRRKKQEKLDHHKKLLDRKLLAREVANEISRDKSSVVANKLLSKFSSTKLPNDTAHKAGSFNELVNTKEINNEIEKSNNECEAVKTNDMATQWDMETIPHEWEPAVPALSLPTDKDTAKDSDDYVASRGEKNKRLDLFAVSKEMPPSLQGKHTHDTKGREPGRPSLTIVSEYLQNRTLRLRETAPVNIHKKLPEDMQSLKQTILRTRTSKPEGSHFNKVCQVLDEQIVPVPMWRAEKNCQLYSNSAYNNSPVPSRQFKSVTNSQINQIFSSIRPVQKADLLPSPVLRGTSPFRRTKVSQRSFSAKAPAFNDKSKNIQENGLHRKSSVLMYNHSTRDSRDLPYGSNQLVVRDLQSEEDAYSQAMKEVSALGIKDGVHHKKVQDMRNKVAMTKQNVEKEYKDTMNFLNSLPKEKCTKVIKNAYMDERRQQMQHESRQQKMQQEYKKIEKECRRHHCLNNSHNKSKSPAKQDFEENFESKDFQYSWMPVPESDGNLAIHAIPNSVKSGKTGNSVKFSKVDSYHEYRSRHKHTPPTKDTNQDKHQSKKVVRDKDAFESSDSSSIITDISSVENLKINTKKKQRNVEDINKNLSDSERIIIYKVLDSRNDKKSKRQTKLLNEIAKSLTCIEKVKKTGSEDNEQLRKFQTKHIRAASKSADNTVSFEQLNEGVYKMVEDQGDNVASMYFNDRDKLACAQSDDIQLRSCNCQRLNKNQPRDKDILHWESGDCLQAARTKDDSQCTSAPIDNMNKPPPPMQPSTAPSTSSFITATNDKGSASEGGYIKLVDETGQEAGKFFVGATGFLNNNSYEVVIQLRKKDGTSLDKKTDENSALNQNKQTDSKINEKEELLNKPVDESTGVRPLSDDDIREVLGCRSLANTESILIPPEPEPTVKNILSEASNIQSNTDEKIRSPNNIEDEELINVRLLQSSSAKKNMCDKSVHTQLTEVQIPEQPSRAATTAYTQTSTSPMHRPVFFHMSSSTSTAYMSPPEMILPKFLRHDIPMTEDEIYGTQTIEMNQNEYCEEYAGCTCRKCLHARNLKIGKIHVPIKCTRRKDINKKIITPPNSAINSPELRHDVLINRNVPNKAPRMDKRKCKHRNHGNGDTDKRHCHRNNKNTMENRSTRNINVRVRLNETSRKKSSSSQEKKPGQSSLNPIIKDYVNKLLALNREGLKAVEVADQECSSVCTPGSSIINVPFNVDERKSSVINTISLQQIKSLLKQQIMQENLAKRMNNTHNSLVYSFANNKSNLKYSSSRTSRKKPVHKVKSLNISKNLIQINKSALGKSTKPISQSSTDEIGAPVNIAKKTRSRSSPTPRQVYSVEPFSRFNDSESTVKNSTGTDEHLANRSRMSFRTKSVSPKVVTNKPGLQHCGPQLPSHRATTTDLTLDSASTEDLQGYNNKADIPVSMSTQTSHTADVNTDTNFMKLAEDKLHNMEKIADLTEKCTKRLSNLAKVLEEVRKNKSLAYSQISSAESTDSQSDHKSDKQEVSPIPCDSNDILQRLEIESLEPVPDKEITLNTDISRPEYTSVLKDILKPVNKVPEHNVLSRPNSPDKLDSPLHLSTNTAELAVKRPKPPPALSRLTLKHGQEYIIPHELSTVIEVDSPMSMKHKNHSARNETKDASDKSNRSSPEDNIHLEGYRKRENGKESSVNPDLLQTNADFSKNYKMSSTESSDDTKFQMIDLKQFNEIMLEPFISIQEYAKQYNMEPPDEGSNLEEIQRENADDISSLHSDGSLPDVIAELLKRNIIAEPFKFDTGSNINSTTISSESTLSMLALSKARRDRKRSNAIFQNKENIGETSDTLSISSNPDLENAFKKLGMGWASSTLKKTKERLALSSSSNTSSSSLSQFKIKSFNQDIPALVTDSVSSVVNVSKGIQNKNMADNSKNAEQQTTLSNSMTVKEFLRNELAKKITFTNKSNANDTQEEFVSLFETKMPDEMKDTSQVKRGERSVDSAPSGPNRARTSTPVQLFKSMTYHSSSSSNVSNGLFSNADDLSSVKMTSNSMKNHSTSDKDDLTIPNFSLRMKKNSDCSKSD